MVCQSCRDFRGLVARDASVAIVAPTSSWLTNWLQDVAIVAFVVDKLNHGTALESDSSLAPFVTHIDEFQVPISSGNSSIRFTRNFRHRTNGKKELMIEANI